MSGGQHSGFNHPTDSDFLALEDIVYGFTRRFPQGSSSSSEDDDSDYEDSEDSSDSNSDSSTTRGNPYYCRRQSRHRDLSCPVCKTVHPFCPPPSPQNNTNDTNTDHNTDNSTTNEEHRYSHAARVVYASFGCPICLEDPAGPPMVVLPCGHAVCQDDFRLLGGTTPNTEEDAQVRQQASDESHQQRERLREQQREERLQQRLTRQQQRLDNSSRNRNRNNGSGDEDEGDNGNGNEQVRRGQGSWDLLRPFYGNAFAGVDDDAVQMMMAFAASLDHVMAPDNDDDNDDEAAPPSAAGQLREIARHQSSLGRSGRRRLRQAIDNQRHVTPIRPPRTFHQFIAESSEDDDDDDDDDEYDSEDAREVELAEFRYNLMEYHPANEEEHEPPEEYELPSIGHWMLVPDITYGNHLHQPLFLVYYCETSPGSHTSAGYGVRPIRRCAPGTRLIPNGKHGIYIHTPPRDHGRNTHAGTSRTVDDLWDVFYVKNDKPGGSNSRRRQTSVSDAFEPKLKYQISKRASLVSDGNGGLWALFPESVVPISARRSSIASLRNSESDNNNNNSSSGSRSDRKFKLVHYTSRDKDGFLVGDGAYLAPTKMYMDQSGGVLVLTRDSEEQSSRSSVWHISHYNVSTLIQGGITQGTRLVEDSKGVSLFLISAARDRLRSGVKRVIIEKEPSTGVIQSRACFSYDLDIPAKDIKRIVDCANFERFYMHCRIRSGDGGSFCWKLCCVSPQTPATTNDDQTGSPLVDTASDMEQEIARIEPLDVICPRNCQIVSDRTTSGVWLLRKPWEPTNPGDRCFVHIQNEEDVWLSPRVFPAGTQLAIRP